jgi:hypothetical protein
MGRAGGDEQDRVVVADGTDVADGGLGTFEDAAEFFAAMTVLENADARAIEIEECSLGLAEDCFWQCRGSGREVELPRQRRSSQ